ncbi:hypothetical protein HJFPF1_02780 [Paramyrothecium foliicola]|nr:hypothetical protein HJFPF1_02780 [Paramyrothecium foliicola]
MGSTASQKVPNTRPKRGRRCGMELAPQLAPSLFWEVPREEDPRRTEEAARPKGSEEKHLLYYRSGREWLALPFCWWIIQTKTS